MSALPGESDDAFARRLQASEAGAMPVAQPHPAASTATPAAGPVPAGNPQFVYSNQPLPVYGNVYQTGYYTTIPVGTDPVRGAGRGRADVP
jgi:hypothetical protein